MFPNIYLYTSQGITTLLEHFYKLERRRMQAPRDERPPPNPFHVEIVSLLERSLNFMHTGNAACFVGQLMNYTWLGPSLLTDGLPCLNKAALGIRIHEDALHVVFNPATWPLHRLELRPLSSAKAGVLFHYGEDVFNVSVIFTTLLKRTTTAHMPVYTGCVAP